MPFSVTAAQGAVVALGTGSSSPYTFTTINGVMNGPNGPGFEPIMIEARHHGVTTVVKRATGLNVTPVSFDIHYDSLDTNHAALLTAAAARTLTQFRITLTDSGAEVYRFAAYVKMSMKADLTGTNMASIQLDIDGAVTVS
jgi:hypothetical protein